MGYNEAYANADRENRIRKARKLRDILLKAEESKILNFTTYQACPEYKRTEMLMQLFYKMNPNWIADFNALEEDKPEKIRIRLNPVREVDPKTRKYKDPAVFNKLIEKIKDSDNIIKNALSVYLTNKIAHSCQNTIKVLIESEVKAKKIDDEGFEEIATLVRYHFKLKQNLKKTGNTEEQKQDTNGKIRTSLRKLGHYGLKEENLKNLENMGMMSLLRRESQAFYLKDFEISNLLKKLKLKEEIYYGMATELKTKSKGGQILVINLPVYGQFSVHLTNRTHIQEMENRGKDNYNLDEILEKESVMIVPYISEKAKKDLDRNGNISEEDLLRIAKTDIRYSLYLGLKTGHKKETIRKIFNSQQDQLRPRRTNENGR